MKFNLVGKTILCVKQVLYVVGEIVDYSDCQIQFDFNDGTILRLRCAGDGHSVVATDKAWTDPFAGPLSAENKNFLNQSGKWSIFDISHQPHVNPYLGKRIDQVFSIEDTDGRSRGIMLGINGTYIGYVVDSDEGIVVFDMQEVFRISPNVVIRPYQE